MKKIIISLVIFLLFVLLLVFLNNSLKNDKTNTDFSIYVFNAGKADSILIQNNDNIILIDTGEESLTNDILSYLKNHNITHIDYLIITHFDKDHVGSAGNIINNIDVYNVLQSNFIKESEYYTSYINALTNKSIEAQTVSGNLELSLGDMNIIVNGPTTIYDTNESNNSSLIVSLYYKNTSYLFMGDAENARIKDFLSTNSNTYDFIKIPYHGNYLKRLDSLLKSTSPKYAVITASTEEGAEEDTLTLLNKYNINNFITYNGGITITSDGNNIKIDQ